MPENSIEKQLRFFFPRPSRRDWEKIAQQETNGKDPLETLSWRGKDDIKFLPYYDASDVAALPRHHRGLPADDLQQTHYWLNLPAIKVLDEIDANKIAREHLSRGANGVFFYLNQHTTSRIDVLTQEVNFSDHNFFFRLTGEQQFDSTFSNARVTSMLEMFNGALFWESIPKTSKLNDVFARWKKFRALGIVIRPSSPSQEIAQALFEGVQAYEHFAQTASEADVFRSVCFSVVADVSFLESVAKIIALRSLWLQVARAYGQKDYNAADLHIHVRSLAAADGNYAPHENLLKATFAAMAAAAAGCDSLTIEGTADTSLFQRWSVNASNILREESFFGRVANPLEGAYAVEAMSDLIARKAWEIFQRKANAS